MDGCIIHRLYCTKQSCANSVHKHLLFFKINLKVFAKPSERFHLK